MSETAVRHPRRGKSHRQESGTRVYGSGGMTTGLTVCQREMWRMTERIPVERTDEADRCKRCWPTP